MVSNEELAKAFIDLTKYMQGELLTLKQRGPTRTGTGPLLLSGSQYSGTVVSDNPLPPSRSASQNDTTEDIDDAEDSDLVTLLEEATFLEASFGSKLENKTKGESTGYT